MNIDNSLIPMDSFSEVGIFRDTDSYPYTDFTQLQFKGKIDVALLSEAFEEALRQIPIFRSHLVVQRNGVSAVSFWKPLDEPENRLIVEDCRHLTKEPFDPMVFSMRFHAARIQRRMNLQQEYPFRAYLIRIFDDRYIFSIVYQHSAVDPFKAYKVLTQMFVGYHQKITGSPPEWQQTMGMASFAKKSDLLWQAPKRAMFTFPMQMVYNAIRQRIAYGSFSISHIASEKILDYREVKGRHGLRAVFDDFNLIKSLLSRAKRNDATLNDVFLAVALSCITQWNREHDIVDNHFSMWLAVSLKGRTKVSESIGSGLSGLVFLMEETGTRSLDDVIRLFRDSRIDMLEQKFDILFHACASQWLTAMRLLPVGVRKRMFSQRPSSTPITFHLSNLGVVWPKKSEGRFTLDSEIVDVGGFEIDDMHSCPTFGPNTGLGVITRMHNRRLYFNFVCDKFRFRAHEARDLADRFVKGIINAA